MTKHERAQRIAAWTWAAETLGVEVTSQRLQGLVSATAKIRLETFRLAIEAAIESETSGFLPAPGVVHEHAKRIGAKRQEALQAARRRRDRETALLEASASPASPEQIQAIRDRIAGLAGQARTSGRSLPLIRDPGDDSRGMAAVREVVAARAAS